MSGIVLNHHALPFSCKADADQGLLNFFKVLKVCRTAGLKILLVDEDQDKSLMGLELADGYFIRSWYTSANKIPALRDWCRFLRSLETKQPLFEMVHLNSINGNFEVGLHGEDIGKPVLLAAFYFKTFLASFTASAEWNRPYIDVWILQLGATPEQKEGRLLNLCDQASLTVHEEALKHRRNLLISNARDIWQQRKALFPHLSLLDNQIGTALNNWSGRQDVLLKARDALDVLEVFSSKWSTGEYVDYRHEYLKDLGLATRVSGESASISSDIKKKQERLFWLEDGRQVYCENHIKLSDGYRMHFYPDITEKRIYVAYLGTHMRL